MSLLPIIKYPDPVLKQVSETVTEFDDPLREFISQLNATMQDGPGGVGIAAPQVGQFIRLVIVDVSSKKNTVSHGHMVLINPEITKWEGMQKGREGCMSVPDFTGNVIRAERIHLTAYDPFGEQQQYAMEGFEARAVQHEMDHLDGLLFLDRLVSKRHDLFERKVYK